MRLARSTGRWVVPVAAAAVFGFGSTTLHAQTITLVDTTPDRRVDRTRTDEHLYDISYADCVEADEFRFEVDINNRGTSHLEVWAGTSSIDCTSRENRNAEAGDCWPILSQGVSDTTYTISVPAQLIIAQDVTRTPAAAYVPDADVCEAEFGSDTQNVTLYFMLMSGGENIELQTLTFEVGYDLGGPSAPIITSVSAGEGNVVVHWEASSSGDVLEYRIYCVEAEASYQPSEATDAGGTSSSGGTATGVGGATSSGGTVATAGASGTVALAGAAGGGAALQPAATGGVSSTGGAAGADGSTGQAGTAESTIEVNPECPTARLVPGDQPPEDLERCGRSADATRGTANGLENNHNYAIAVSAVDELGNVGPLSEVECGRPIEVDDFFEVYREAQGKGGGGFCAISQRAERGLGLLLAGAFAALCWRRRRRPCQ